jgi:CRP/FNR family transcriptional regulator, nitrogen oxide reductase regulator
VASLSSVQAKSSMWCGVLTIDLQDHPNGRSEISVAGRRGRFKRMQNAGVGPVFRLLRQRIVVLQFRACMELHGMTHPSITSTDLRHIQLFDGLQDDVLSAVAQVATALDLRPREVLYRQGDASNATYVVISGRLRLIQHTREGTDVTMDIYGPGELLALTAALSVSTHAGSCEALNVARVLRLPNDALYTLMGMSPDLMRRVVALLLAQLRDAQDHMRELASEAAECRLARAVLRLAEKAGIKTGEQIRLDVPVTRQSLAEMSGTTLHTASRVLSIWHRAKWVYAGRESLTLLTPRAIQDIAEGQSASLR